MRTEVVRVVLTLIAVEVTNAQVEHTRRFYLDGEPAPGGGEFAFRVDSLGPVVNHTGSAAFEVGLYSPQYGNSEGLFIETGVEMSLVWARHGGNYRRLDDYRANARNQVLLRATQNDNVRVLWLWEDGDAELIAVSGQDAPEIPGATLGGVSAMDLNESGGIVFVVGLVGDVTPDDNSAIYARLPGEELSLIAREGDRLPGPEDVYIDSLTGRPIYIDERGRVSQAIPLRGPEVIDYWNDEGILQVSRDSVDLVVRAGDPVPGLQELHFGGPLHQSGVTPEGHWLVHSSLLDPDGSYANRDALVWIDDVETDVVVTSGQIAPGTGGREFTNLFLSATIGSTGTVVFDALLTGDSQSNAGVWLWSRDELQLIAQTGVATPVLDGGSFSYVTSLGVNAVGDVFYEGGVNGSADSAFAIFDAITRSHALVAREGAAFDVNVGEGDPRWRTVTEVYVPRLGSWTRPGSSCLNDEREFTYRLGFGASPKTLAM